MKITFLFLFPETTCVGNLFFQVYAYEDMCRIFIYIFFNFPFMRFFYCGEKFSAKNFPFPCCIFIVSENCHLFCNVWSFAMKIHPLTFGSHQRKTNSSVIMERHLNILEAPWKNKKKPLMRKKLGSSTQKFLSGTFLVSLKQLIWAIRTRRNPECSKNITVN